MSKALPLIISWYARHARDLPWRGKQVSPWEVLVSEVMLQQTPVARVLPIYEQWMSRWPTPSALASSSPGDAVRVWGDSTRDGRFDCTQQPSPVRSTTTEKSRHRLDNC